MDPRVRKSLLYDFYGQLLTGRQRDLFQLYEEDDLSLGEIAERTGVSRQAVHDMLKRGERALERYEAQLGLVRRHVEREACLREVRSRLRAVRAELARLSGEGEIGAALRRVGADLDELDRLLSDNVP